MTSEPSDPVERADQRRQAVGSGDVTEKADGSIEQRPHGNMDETLVPKGKDHPGEGPYVPENDGVVPDTTPDAGSDHPAAHDYGKPIADGTAKSASDAGDHEKIDRKLDELDVSTTRSGKDQSGKADTEGSNSSSKNIDEQSDNEGAVAAVKAGMGITSLGYWACRRELEEGSLVPILTDWSMVGTKVHAYFPLGRATRTAARAFINFLLDEFSESSNVTRTG